MKHTPGPWTAHTHHPCLGHDVAHINGLHGCAIAMVHSGAENINPGREHIVTREETIANASLIAAAPDLLAALQEITDLCKREPANPFLADDMDRVARAAIAKATGSE